MIQNFDPVTKKTIELEAKHFMRGGTYAIDGTSRGVAKHHL